MKTAFRGIASE